MAPKIPPQVAVQDFLDDRESEVRPESLRNYKYTLRTLIAFCEEREIEYVNDLDGYTLKQYKLYRASDDITQITLKNNLSTIRVFIRWCEQAGLVERGLAEMVQLPSLSKKERVDETMLSGERVEEILEYLYTYEYAHRRHAIFELMWHTCMRVGTVCALDLGDYHPKQGYVEVRHRPETDTPLKNGYEAEREVNLSEGVRKVLDDYIEVHRNKVTDKHGREPLFTTTQRASHNVIRKNLYALTRPCETSGYCPHDREISECEATVVKQASKCPSSVSPHPVRRSAITYHLNRGWPQEKLSERANVSVDVLEEHYDGRTEQEKRIGRQRYLDKL